jgi:Sap, sulfolipid-1-addressing protein
MPVQAIPLALIASLSPLGLTVLLLLAQADRYRGRVLVFLAGAALCTLAVGFAIVFALHGIGLGLRTHRTPRYGLRLAVGLILIGAAVLLARRPARSRSGQSRLTRAARDGGLIAAFIVGVAMALPSPSYLSALQEVGSSGLSTVAVTVWVLLIVALTLITIEIPAVVLLLAPDWSLPRLTALHGWLGRNGRALLVLVLAVLGGWQFIEGLTGLI